MKIHLAEMFPLGDHLREEIYAHGWQTIEEFGEDAKLLPGRASAIVEDGMSATFLECEKIATALGCSAEFLLRIQMGYLRWKEDQDAKKKAP